jgi:dTDP-6-deoxy-L-talose 4-dehydrogenase (NAD+)
MGSMHEIGYFEGKIDENTPSNPISLYGIAKDTLRKAVFLDENLDKLIWLRAFYIYGNDYLNPSVFGKLAQSEFQGKKTFPINSGKNKYDFIHINELSEQIALASTQFQYSGIINCCSGIPVSLSDMLEKYIKDNKFNIKLDLNKYPDRAYDSPLIYGDNKIIEEIKKKANEK